MDDGLGFMIVWLLYTAVVIALVGTVLVALWRLTKAHESIARSLEGMERSFRERP